ncbi:MAG: helix-turn-helix domain-containing protein [Polyangiaceae bacterium]
MNLAADFSTEEASKLSRLSVDRVVDWDKTGFLRASIPPPRRGISRRYTFRDVVALRVASELRNRGVSLQMLRKVVEYLRAREGLSTTEALARTNLVTDGERVYEVAGDVTIHVPSGQRMMVHVTIPLDQVVSEVQRKARALRRAA